MKDKYGEWTVLGPSPDKKYYSRCRCSCGVIKDVKNSSLKLGKSLSCGHKSIEDRRKYDYEKSDKNIIGKKFGQLVALKRVSKIGPSKYLCKCTCGNIAEVKATDLLVGSTISCGCLRKNIATESMDKIKELGWQKLRDGQIDGTVIYSLNQKVSKNSTTGIKGVSKLKSGKYRAYINLRRIQVNLGTFDTIGEAKEARLAAEKELYDPILEKHKKENN